MRNQIFPRPLIWHSPVSSSSTYILILALKEKEAGLLVYVTMQERLVIAQFARSFQYYVFIWFKLDYWNCTSEICDYHWLIGLYAYCTIAEIKVVSQKIKIVRKKKEKKKRWKYKEVKYLLLKRTYIWGCLEAIELFLGLKQYKK
jgi:hypothetical protein